MIQKQILTLAVLASAGLMAACDGIGDGNRPEEFFITGGPTDGGPLELTECVQRNIGLLARFTDGRIGDFTTRGTWTSSNPDVVLVSDGDLDIPGLPGFPLVRGRLVPVEPGTATITGEFLGQSASIDVTVTAIGPVRVEPAESTTAIGASRSFEVFGEVDGEDVELSTLALWGFTNPDDTIATINVQTGSITGVGDGELTNQVDLDFCGQSAQTTVRVAAIETLEARKEFDASNELVVTTSERFDPIASFANGDEQDLTGQVDYISSREDIAAFDGSVGLVDALRALVADPAPVEVTVRFDVTPADSEDDNFVTSAPVQVTVVDADLDSIAISPANPTIDGLGTVDLAATGTYDGGGRTQDISRHVLWTSDNADVFVTGNPANPGLVTSLANEDTTAEITATRIEVDGETSEQFTDTTTVTVTATPEDPAP